MTASWPPCRLLTLLFLLLAAGIPHPAFAQEASPDIDGEPRAYRVDAISIKGNKVTKERIIRREIPFTEGDVLSGEGFEDARMQARSNLMNTTLFNYVDITSDIEPDTLTGIAHVRVSIFVTERWYLWPSPILTYEDRNFSTWLAEGDFTRISYGMSLLHNNFRGMRESLGLTLQYGYDRQAWLEYHVPYLDRRQSLGLSLAGGVEYMHEAPYATVDARRQLVKDPDGYLLSRRFAMATVSYRPGIFSTQTFIIGFEDVDWGDTLLALNPSLTHSGSTDERYLRLHYKLKLDHRDYASYPLSGWYADIELQKEGLGLFEEAGPDYFFLKSTLRKYAALGRSNYLAAGLHLKLGSAGGVPYYLNKGLGYGRDFARGYENYVIDGQAYAMLKLNAKRKVLQTKVFQVPLPLTERLTKTHVALYANLYSDIAYVRDAMRIPGNTLANRWLYSAGVGLDLVTTYDKVFRLDYSLNHLGEGGVYIHFIAPV